MSSTSRRTAGGTSGAMIVSDKPVAVAVGATAGVTVGTTMAAVGTLGDVALGGAVAQAAGSAAHKATQATTSRVIGAERRVIPIVICF